MSSLPHVLSISNGHGEDQVASRIAAELLKLDMRVSALPIVGEGKAYQHLGIPLLGTTQVMPSGGFIYQDWRQFWRDIQGGLLGLTWRQLRWIGQMRRQVDLILAVGDIVPLLMAWQSQRPYAFVGTAKSDYYFRDEGGLYRRIPWLQPVSDYLPWERWLMSRPRCRGCFVRDALTAQPLQERHCPVWHLGNPMMDGLEPPTTWPLLGDCLDPARPALLLLPGSRPPEAYANWRQMVAVVGALDPTIQPFAAITPNLQPERLREMAQPLRIPLLTGRFAECLHRAEVVLAMAGTATEQAVGLGKPVVTLPGLGPQFTAKFAEAQTRLLGSSIFLATPSTAAATIQHLLTRLQSDPDFRPQRQAHGQRRMGSPGASQRIAQQIQKMLSPSISNQAGLGG
ncbi:MAG: lipid-A-disaccharide synthase-related protein [Cyanobacteriota bacterium]|nr:lipid-A-disaccharide synthase-related protein [Cyanobacteriota bacterium]